MARSYEVRLLPIAVADLEEVVSYVSRDLGNEAAAQRLAERLTQAIRSLGSMPYRHRVYWTLRPLEHEHRALLVGNYLVFYWVEEEPAPSVTVARVLYARSDAARRLQAGEDDDHAQGRP